MFHPSARLGLLFVFVGSLAVYRYMAGDLISTGIGAVVCLVLAVFFVRAVIKEG